MPANRSEIHISKLPDFVRFAESRGYRVEPTKGYYERLRLRRDGAPLIFHQRTGTDHLTVPFGEAQKLCSAFIRGEKKEG